MRAIAFIALIAGAGFSTVAYADDQTPAARLAQAGTLGDAATISRMLGNELHLKDLANKSREEVLSPAAFAARVKGCFAYMVKEPAVGDPAAMVAWACNERPLPTNKCQDMSYEVMFYPGLDRPTMMDWTGLWAKRCGPVRMPPIPAGNK